MNEFLRSFVQAPDGSWTCIRTCSHMFGSRKLDIAAGASFRQGQFVNSVDVASFLDHRHAFAKGN